MTIFLSLVVMSMAKSVVRSPNHTDSRMYTYQQTYSAGISCKTDSINPHFKSLTLFSIYPFASPPAPQDAMAQPHTYQRKHVDFAKVPFSAVLVFKDSADHGLDIQVSSVIYYTHHCFNKITDHL